MGKVRRLVTRREREERAKLADAEAALRDLPPEALAQWSARERASLSDARKVLREKARSQERDWAGGYGMYGRIQTEEVWKRIQALPSKDRPVQVRDAFIFVLLALDRDTGDVTLSRAELAEKIGCDLSNVSKVMATLERLGVVERERRPEPGYRGRGRVVYVINAHTAWNGDLAFRKRVAATQTPPSDKRAKLKLVQPAEAAE